MDLLNTTLTASIDIALRLVIGSIDLPFGYSFCIIYHFLLTSYCNELRNVSRAFVARFACRLNVVGGWWLAFDGLATAFGCVKWMEMEFYFSTNA